MYLLQLFQGVSEAFLQLFQQSRKKKSLVKSIDTFLMSLAIPFAPPPRPGLAERGTIIGVSHIFHIEFLGKKHFPKKTTFFTILL